MRFLHVGVRQSVPEDGLLTADHIASHPDKRWSWVEQLWSPLFVFMHGHSSTYTCTLLYRSNYRWRSIIRCELLAWHSNEYVCTYFQPIRKSDQHGEGFYYIVSYKRQDIRTAPELKINVTNWQQSELVIGGQEMFKEYKISVQSANWRGLAPSQSVVRKLGFSGQAGMLLLFLLLILQLADFLCSLKSVWFSCTLI